MNTYNNEAENDITTMAEIFQKDCHKTVEDVMNYFKSQGKSLSDGFVQDFTNVWLFKKLAELELRFQQLEEIINKA